MNEKGAKEKRPEQSPFVRRNLISSKEKEMVVVCLHNGSSNKNEKCKTKEADKSNEPMKEIYENP